MLVSWPHSVTWYYSLHSENFECNDSDLVHWMGVGWLLVLLLSHSHLIIIIISRSAFFDTNFHIPLARVFALLPYRAFTHIYKNIYIKWTLSFTVSHFSILIILLMSMRASKGVLIVFNWNRKVLPFGYCNPLTIKLMKVYGYHEARCQVHAQNATMQKKALASLDSNMKWHRFTLIHE